MHQLAAVLQQLLEHCLFSSVCKTQKAMLAAQGNTRARVTNLSKQSEVCSAVACCWPASLLAAQLPPYPLSSPSLPPSYLSGPLLFSAACPARPAGRANAAGRRCGVLVQRDPPVPAGRPLLHRPISAGHRPTHRGERGRCVRGGVAGFHLLCALCLGHSWKEGGVMGGGR